MSAIKERLDAELAEDREFLRKLRPELIRKRALGEAPTEVKPTSPSGPQLGKRPKSRKTGGPNPFLVVGAALFAGVALAKWLDWRGHAHPRW